VGAGHGLGPLTMAARRVTLRYGDVDHAVDVLKDAADIDVAVAGETLRLTRDDGASVRVEGDPGGPAWAIAEGTRRWVFHDGCAYELEVQEEGRRRKSASHGSLAAPMPATVGQIRVAAGEHVTQGQTLLILEAMKMELPVRAEADGVVLAVLCQEGELVQPGRALIEIGPPESA
jgi:biotin carboxyl carrier protein